MRTLTLTLVITAAFGAASSSVFAQPAFQDDPKGYVRLDTDLDRSLFWIGGAYPVGDVDLQGDLILENRLLQADLGVAFYAGALALLPTVGISFDFGREGFDRLIAPRLFAIIEGGPIYFESWLQLTLRDLFVEGTFDEFYTRDFLLFVVVEQLAFGPQVELTYAVKNGPPDGVVSLPVGGQIASRWGQATLALFLGYETADYSRGKSGLAGRFTFTHAWP
jgi:hypothetical protein